MRLHVRRWGFTLVELLVTIAVIAVVISLLLPALKAARERAGRMAILSNIRQLGVSTTNYLNAFGETFPFLAPGSWVYTMPPDEALRPNLMTSDPWALRYLWPTVYNDVAPWRQHYRTWVRPGTFEPDAPWRVLGSAMTRWPMFEYSTSFIARPDVWREGSLPASWIIGPTRLTEVQHPSAKAMFFEMLAPPSPPSPGAAADGRDSARAVLAVDGSAAQRRDSQAGPVGRNNLTNSRTLYHDTPNGVLGNDW